MQRDVAINALMLLSAEGDSEASNVLDMVDTNECGMLGASGNVLWAWYMDAKEARGNTELLDALKRAERYSKLMQKSDRDFLNAAIAKATGAAA